MFRYIGLAWDREDEEQSGAAVCMSHAIQARRQWRPEVVEHGLHVFTTDAQPRRNRAHPLPAERGIVLGRLFRRDRLDEHDAPDVQLDSSDIARIRHTEGRSLVADFWGRYVAFLRDDAGKTSVLRDPSGGSSCFVLVADGVSVVFSWLEDVLEMLPWVGVGSVDWTAVAAHIQFTALGGQCTALDGVRRVLPGELVALNSSPERSELIWHAAEIARDPVDWHSARAADELRRTVRSCVRSWAACHDHVLLRLSGGVDSSVLLSCLDPSLTSTMVTCVNYHSPGADSDERQYARLAADRARRPLLERERNVGVRLERMLEVARTPSPTNYLGRLGAPGMNAALAAELGATAMFTGGGGDQLFFELRSSWPASDYLWRHGLVPGLWGAAMDAARLGRVTVWRALRQALVNRLRQTDPWATAGRHLSMLDPHAVPPMEQRTRFIHPALRRGHGLPIGKLNQAVQLVYPVDFHDPYDPFGSPELIDPLLSQPVIELCLRLPTYLLTQGGRGRALARKAFAADVPTEIINRRSKGGLEEHVRLILQRNQAFARSVLLDGELVRRGILDRAKVEAAFSGNAATLAAHTHEIHVYVGIEAWLRRWREPRAEHSLPAARVQ